jgi:hypothetical protein
MGDTPFPKPITCFGASDHQKSDFPNWLSLLRELASSQIDANPK